MKLYLLAAAAMIAVPAFAQDDMAAPTQAPADPSSAGAPIGMSQNDSTDSSTMSTGTPMGDSAAPAPKRRKGKRAMAGGAAAGGSMDNGAMAGGAMATGSMSAPEPTTGGYQPAQPAMSGPMQPGATVRFQAAPSPDQAYPAPAPLASYPVCKKGQYDKCRNPGGK